MNKLFIIVTNTSYRRVKNAYGEPVEPYYTWDTETSTNHHRTRSGACARIERELAAFKRDYPDGVCCQIDLNTFHFIFADGCIEEWQIVEERLYD